MEHAPKEALMIDKTAYPVSSLCSQARVGPRLVHTPYTQQTDKYQYDQYVQYVRLFTDRRTVRGRVLVQAVFGDSVLRNYLPA